MRIVQSIAAMRSLVRSMRRAPEAQTLGLVPTMGALHEGHLSLVRAARAMCDCVAVSIFVNPLQFGPHEDFDRYPRTFDEDCALLAREQVDLVFAPSATEMFPADAETFVEVAGIGGRLDGDSRPGHFRGVATVVSKLFHIVQPDRAFFGQKDAAQVAVLGAMVRDLNFDLELVVCPIARDEQGLALSSRNRYLTPAERSQALALSRTLRMVSHAASRGERDASVLAQRMRRSLEAAEGIRLDYAEVVDPQTLLPVRDLDGGALAAVAAWVGQTRLIDNILLAPQPIEPRHNQEAE